MPAENDLFVNDDLKNSAENRMNHVLFGLFLHDGYRREVLDRLGVDGDAIIYKPCDRPWGRPDFAIESHGGKTLGYIEVELDKDLVQLNRYRNCAEVPVYSFGREQIDHNITLQALVDIGEDAAGEGSTPQFYLMTRHLAKQVRESAGHRKNSAPAPVQDQLETRLGEALLRAGMVNWKKGFRLQPCQFYGRTNGSAGISVRVFSPKPKVDKTVSLFNITGGRPIVEFSGYAHLSAYLPRHVREAVLDGWRGFIWQRFHDDIKARDYNQNQHFKTYHNSRLSVELSKVEENIQDLLLVLFPLTQAEACQQEMVHEEENSQGRQSLEPHAGPTSS